MGMGIKKSLAIILSILLAASPALAQSGGAGRVGAGGIGVPPPRAQMQGSTHSRVFTKLIFDDGAITYNGSHVHVSTSATSPALVANYVPYIGANKDVDLGSQHVSADTVRVNELIGAYLVSTIVGSMDMRASPWELIGADLRVPNLFATNLYGKYDNAHPEYIPTSYIGHTHPIYDPLESNGYTPWSVYTTNQHAESYAALIHQHDEYQPVGSYADATHQHPNYTARIDNIHPEYQPAGSYANATHQHPNYVPYLDAAKQHVYVTSIGAQHLIATAGEFISTHVSAIPMPDIFDVSNHYTGFENSEAGTLSFDNGTQAFTFTGTNIPIWIDGRRYSFNTDSVTITDATGLYWIYIDLVNGVPDLLMAASIPDQFSKCLVATVYWNTTTNASLIGGERHWMGRDKWWHEYAHETIGARYHTGLTGTFTNTTMSLTAGEIYDEDIEHIEAGVSTTADILYKNGLASFEFDINQTTPYKAIAGVLQYNNGNTLTAVGNNQYVAYWVYATSSTTRIIQILAGQRTDGTIANARTNNTPDTLSIANLPSPEMKLLYRVIYRNVGGTATYVETADYRNVTPVPNGAFTPTDHSTLSKLNWSQAAHSFDTDLDVQPYDVKANNMHTTVQTGTAPYQTESITLNSNLNADYVDGYHALGLPYSDNSHIHPQYSPVSLLTHQHPNYQAVGSYADASHIHPQYAPQSLLTHMHDTYYAAKSYESTVDSIAQVALNNTHAVATAGATGFMPILSTVATEYLDGTGAFSTPAGSGGVTGHLHPYYTPMDLYSVHTHPNYQAAGDYASGSHMHDTYYAGKGYEAVVDNVAQVALNNTHANVTTSAAGFVPTLSNVATEFLNGQGSWSTPAGGGGSSTSAVDQFTIQQHASALRAAPRIELNELYSHMRQSEHEVSTHKLIVNGRIDVFSDNWTIDTANSLYYTYDAANDQYTPQGGSTPTGGTITTSGGNTIHTFKLADSGTSFVVPAGASGTIRILLVAGGGSGGSWGAGGGGGGVRDLTGVAVSAGSYTITVGDGGARSETTDGNGGNNGGNSSFGALYSATGGGAGSRVNGSYTGNNGGCGGGGGEGSSGGSGNAGSYTPVEGYAGGAGGNNAHGGGGGAGAVGTTVGSFASGAGGDGKVSDITGANVTYGGGGGGCGRTGGSGFAASAGGAGGGGAGHITDGDNGTDDLGGGGGGGGLDAVFAKGGSGGSGIVIISYTTNSIQGSPYDMILTSKATTANNANPYKALLAIQEEDLPSVTLNTDIKGYVSTDGGSTHTQVTLVDYGYLENLPAQHPRMIAGIADVSANAGSSMTWKIRTFNGKSMAIKGLGMTWESN